MVSVPPGGELALAAVAGLTGTCPGKPGLIPPGGNGLPAKLEPPSEPLATLLAGAGAPIVPLCTVSLPPSGRSTARVPNPTIPLT